MPFLQGSFAKEPYFRITLLVTIPCRMPKSESASLYSWDSVATRCSCSLPHSEDFTTQQRLYHTAKAFDCRVSCQTARHSPDVCKNWGSFANDRTLTRFLGECLADDTRMNGHSLSVLPLTVENLAMCIYICVYIYIYIYIYVSCRRARHSPDVCKNRGSFTYEIMTNK